MTRDLQLNSANIALSKRQYDDIVLDGSSSMIPIWYDMLAAIDGYVAQLKVNQLESHIRLSIFTSGPPENIDLVGRNCALSSWIPLATDPVGSEFRMTPLFDAINVAGRRLQKLDPIRAALTLVTDGGENGSLITSEVQARAVLDWVRAKGWQVTFIGCNFDNSQMARALGATPASAIGVHKSHLGEAIRALADKRTKYASTGAPMHWSEDERSQFGGYLGAPANG